LGQHPRSIQAKAAGVFEGCGEVHARKVAHMRTRTNTLMSTPSTHARAHKHTHLCTTAHVCVHKSTHAFAHKYTVLAHISTRTRAHIAHLHAHNCTHLLTQKHTCLHISTRTRAHIAHMFTHNCTHITAHLDVARSYIGWLGCTSIPVHTGTCTQAYPCTLTHACAGPLWVCEGGGVGSPQHLLGHCW